MEYFRGAGITKDSTPEDIRVAYLNLARTHHPDRGGDTATFQAIHRAFEELEASGASGTPDPKTMLHEMFKNNGEAMIDSVYQGLKMFFKGEVRRSPDKHVDLVLPLSDIYWGKTVVVQINRERFSEGVFMPEKCMLEISVTPQSKEIRCEGKCSDSPAFDAPGDIIFVIKCEKQKDWEISKNGQDLKTTVTLTFAESLLGWSKVLEGHPKGEPITVSVKDKVTLNKTEISIAGAGMPLVDGGYGSLIVLCKVMEPELNPSTLSCEERRILTSIFLPDHRVPS